MLTRAAARRALEASHNAEEEHEIMEVEDDSQYNADNVTQPPRGIQRRRQVSMEEEVGAGHRRRQVILQEELMCLEGIADHENAYQHALVETQHRVVEQERRIEGRLHQLVAHNGQQLAQATETSEKRIQQQLEAQLHQSQEEICVRATKETQLMQRLLQEALQKAELVSCERHNQLSAACASQLNELSEKLNAQVISAAQEQASTSSSLMADLSNRITQSQSITQTCINEHSAQVSSHLESTMNDARAYTDQQVSDSEARLQQKLDDAARRMRSDSSQQTAEIARQLQPQLQTTQKRIETNARGIENRIQSKLDQQNAHAQQQADLKFRELKSQWKESEREVSLRAEKLLNSNLERQTELIQERLQQRLEEAQAHHLRETDAKTQCALAAMNLQIEKTATHTAELLVKYEQFESRIELAIQQTKQDVHENLTSIMLDIDKHNPRWSATPIATIVASPPIENQPTGMMESEHGVTTSSERLISSGESSISSTESKRSPQQSVVARPKNGFGSNLTPLNFQGDQRHQRCESTALTRLNLFEARIAAQRDVELRSRERAADLRRRAKLRL